MTETPFAAKFLHMVETKPRYPEFAKRLNAVMHEAGVTITDLKNRLNITYEMARRYTLGIAMPRDDKLFTIAKFLGTDAAQLKFGTGKSAPDIEISSDGQQSSVCLAGDLRPKWPFKKVTPERVTRLSQTQRKQIDDALDMMIRGFEADQNDS